jgi:GGDEF domain-containing protein
MSSTINRVQNRQSERIGTLEHHRTSSIGVMLISNHEASTEEIINFADTAMYKA